MLNARQLNEFSENGFTKVENALSPAMLAALRDAVDQIAAGEENTGHLAWSELPGGKKSLNSINHLALQKNPVFAAFFGSQQVLTLAEQLCGPDFFPVQDFSVIKTLGEEHGVGWHRDVKSGSAGKSFMAGFYLDDADAENGALRVVSGSHRIEKDICEVEKMESVAIPAFAGDAIVHDLMLAHSSGILHRNQQRRVVYIEFMSSEKARNENVYTADFITARTQLLPALMRSSRHHFPDLSPYTWLHPQKENFPEPENARNEIERIYGLPFRMKAANYCFPGMSY